MILREIFRLFYRMKRLYNMFRPAPLLLNLPIEILLCIFNEMLLADLTLLSQTCRTMRSLLWSQCSSTIKEASVEQRMLILHELGNRLPDHRLCTVCRVLHPLDLEDVPTGFWYVRPSPLCPAEYPRRQDFAHIQYAIRHHQVQLAVKYSRMKGVHQNYKRGLLKTFHSWQYSNPGILERAFLATPAVVEGRFILMVTFNFTAGCEQVNRGTLLRTDILICDHLAKFGTYEHSETLRAYIQSAFDAFENRNTTARVTTSSFSCKCCPTDVTLEISNHHAAYKIWYDLGTGAYPIEDCWRRYTEYTLMPFEYEHGSVRDTWYRSMARR